MDRTTGQVLSVDPFVPITTSSGVDLQTGRLNYNPDKEPRTGETVIAGASVATEGAFVLSRLRDVLTTIHDVPLRLNAYQHGLA
jgi:hypothetical protein